MARLRNGKARDKLVVGLVRRDRAGLLRTTALQAAAMIAFAAVPAGRAAAQPAPTARPQGGQVVGGQASISQTQAQTSVVQGSQRAAIDWRSFDVGSGHTVAYQQPNSSAVVLNRVTSPDPSQIAGRITANGQVIITNQSGVVFHQGSQVNAAGLVVSAAGITNQNFMAGRMVFGGTPDTQPRPDAHVTNAGSITVKEAGLAALVAPRVANSGTITARMGRAVLAGAEAHTVDLYGDGLLSIDVTGKVRQAPRGADGKPVTALVTNTGTVVADGGTVTLTAAAADGIVQDLVQAGGRIRANTVGDRPGRIEVAGTGGSVVVEGRLSADGWAPGSTGGTVALNTTGAVRVAGGARVTADGDAGGGTVAIGTTPARALAQGPALGRTADAIPAGTARQVSVAPGARIGASARSSGRGGTVAVLSTEATSMGGQVTARGGRSGGDGGKVEVSGARGLRLTGRADVSSPKGRAGTILIDPVNLTISENGTDTNPNVPPPADANISAATFNLLTGNVALSATQDITTTNVTPLGTAAQSSITFTAGRNITIGGPIDLPSTSGSVTLSAGNRVTVTVDGRISAGPGALGPTSGTPGAAAGTITLNAGAGGISLLGNLTALDGQTSPTGGIDGFAGGSVTLGGVGGVFGPVTQGTGSTISSPALVGTAASAALDSRTNTVNDVNFTTNAGGFSFANSTPLTPGNTLGVSVTAADGQTLRITADSLAVRGLQALGGTVVVEPFSAGRALEITTGAATPGTLSLGSGNLAAIRTNGTNGAGNAVTGTLQFGSPTAGNTALGGPINLDSANVASRLVLLSGGDVRQGSGSTLAVTTLSGQAASVVLGNSNAIPNLAGFTTTGKFALDTNTGLNVTAPVTGANVNLSTTGGDIVLGANITATAAGGYVRLDTDNGTSLATSGDVRQNGGIVSADLFSGTARSVDLTTTPGSRIGQVGFNLTDPDLGNIQLGTVGTSGDFRIASTSGIVIGGALLSQTGTVGLTSAGAITQDALGSVSGASLTGSAASVALTGAGNAIPALASFSTTGPFSLTTTGALAVNGPVSGSDVTLISPGTLTLNGNVTGNTVALNSGGATTQADASIITAGTLTGSAGNNGFSAANVTLTGANRITTLGNYSAPLTSGTPSAFTLNNLQALRLAGTVNTTAASSNVASGTVRITATGDVVQDAGSAIRTGALSGSATSAAFTSTLNAVGSLNGYVATVGGLSLFTQLTQSPFAATPLPLQVSGTNSVPTGQQITLRADQMAFGAGAQLSAPQGTVLLAPLTAARAVELIDNETGANTASLSIQQAGLDTISTGTLQVGIADTGPISIGNAGSAISLAGRAGTLRVVSAGAVTQGAGATLTVPAIAGTAASANLPNANGIATLADFTTTGAFALNSAQALTVNGPVQAGTQAGISSATGLTVAGNVTAPTVSFATTAGGLAQTGGTISGSTTVQLSVAGDVVQSNGAVMNTGLLQGTAGSLSLTTRGNQIAALGPFDAVTSLVLFDGRSLTVAGPVDPPVLTLDVLGDLPINSTLTGGTVTLNATGAITEGVAGRVFATTLQGTAASATLGQANNVATLAGFTTTGGFTLVDATGGLAITGPVVDATQVGIQTIGTLSLQGNVTAPTVALAAGNGGFSFIEFGNITQTAGTVSGSTQVQLQTAGSITQTGGGISTAALTGSSGGTTSLPSAANQVATLGNFSSTGGFVLNSGQALRLTGTVSDNASVGLSAAGDLTLAGTITGPSSSGISSFPAVTLTATGGAITQPGGSIQASSLTGRGDTGASLTSATNQVASLGEFSGGTGDFALTTLATTAAPLQVTGAVTARPGGTLAITTDAVAIQPGGSLTASGGTVALAPLSNDPFQLSSFVPAGTTAAVTADTLRVGRLDGGPVGITGAFDLAGVGTLDLRSGGAITEAAGASLQVGRLTGTAASAALDGANLVGTLGGFTTTGGFSLSNAQGLTVSGPVTDGTTVRLSAAGDLLLTGTVTAPSVSLTTTAGGGLTQSAGTVTGTNTVILSIAGDAVQTGGTVVTGLLQGTARSLSLPSAGNLVANVGPFIAATSFLLTDGRSLAVVGAIDPPDVTMNVAGDLAINSSITGGTVTLNVSGAITEGAAGRVFATTLQGTAASATLGQANQVGTLAGFATTGGFLLQSSGTPASNALVVSGPVTDGASITLGTQGPLTVQGSLTAPSIFLTANRATVGSTSSSATLRGTILHGSGAISGASQVSLLADDAISQTGGSIVAGTLTGASGRVAAGLLDGRTTLASSGNRVGTLGGFSSVGGFTLVDGQALQVAGTVRDATGVALTASGSIAQVSGSAIQTALLTAASTGGDVGLTSALNQVTSLGASSSAGDFALTDSVALGVTGAVQAGGTGRTLALTADTIQFQPGGSLTASGGTVALAPLSNGPFQLSSFVPAGTTAAVTADTLRVGRPDGGAIGLSGTFDLRGALTLDLRSAGAITQPASGVLQVGTVTGSAQSASLDGQNQISLLRNFSTADGFRLRNARSLLVTGNVTDGRSVDIQAAGGILTRSSVGDVGVRAPEVSLTTTAGDLLIGGQVTGTTTVRLAVAGDARTLDAGTLATPLLQGSAASVALGRQIGAIGPFTSAGDLTIENTLPLGVAGTVSVGTGRTVRLLADEVRLLPGGSLNAPGGAVTLEPLVTINPFVLRGLAADGAPSAVTADTARIGNPVNASVLLDGRLNLSGVGALDLRSGGAVAQTSGSSLQAGRITGFAGSATLDGANRIGTLGDFRTRTGFTLNNSQDLALSGAVQDGVAVRLSALGGLALNGSIAAPDVQLVSTGLMTQGAGGAINGGGPVALRSGGAILLSGSVATPGQLSLDANGHVEQFGGSIAAGSLTGTAVELASLSSPANAVSTLDRFALTGSTFILVNGRPLVVQGPVISGTIRIDASGGLTLAGGQLVTRDALLRVLTGAETAGSLVQQGTTLIGSADGSAVALRLALPGSGSASFADLQASGANLILDLGSGSATGNAVVGNLLVLGSGGSARLFGQVSGRTDASAATISLIEPRIDPAYLFNNCIIATACGTAIPPLEPVPVVSELFPKSFQDTLLGSLLRVNQFTADLFTLGILRDPADPNLVLPNISDRDY